MSNLPRVLVADDDPMSRRAVAAKLHRSAIVVEAPDGAEALRHLRLEPFDLAIIDLEMPSLDGYGLLACVRAIPKIRHIPIVVLTASDDRGALEKALIAGATSFLIKPLNWSAFGPHIEHLLALSGAYRVANST
jgi:CheY-like chemotaxis protein